MIMKKHVHLLLALSFLAFIPIAKAQDKKEGKITIQITKEINGEKKTFKGEYENEEQMKADPNYQEFAGEEDEVNFWFGDKSDFELDLDQVRKQSQAFFSFGDDDEAKIFLKNLKGDSSGSFQFHSFSDEDAQEHMKDLHIEIEALLQNLHDGEGKSVFVFSTKKIKVMDVDGDEFGKKGAVTENNKLELEDLSFYPNPSSDGRFKVRFSVPEEDELKIKVFNLDGKEVYNRYFERFGGTYSESMDLSGQDEGIYLLEISQGDKRTTKKIVIN